MSGASFGTAWRRRRAVSALALILLVVAAPSTAGVRDGDGQQVAFEDVVANLAVGDPKVRLESLALLRDAGYLEAVVPVAALLRDQVSEVQVSAIETLVSLFLADEAHTRTYAGGIVRQRGASLSLLAFAHGPGALIANRVPPEVITGLTAALASPAASVRFNAMYALGVFAPAAMQEAPLPEAAAAASRLIEGARAADPNLRLAATHVLGRLFETATQGKAQAELLAARTEVGDQVVAGMNDPDKLVRSASIQSLGAMRYDRAVQALIDQLGHYKRGEPARELLDALARVAHPSSLSVFSALLDNADEQVRRLAVEGIGRAGDDEAFYGLGIRTTRDRSKFVKQAMAFVRARRGDTAGLGPLMEGFRNARLAPVAWGYLLELGSPAAGALALFSTHKDWRVRAAVADALGIIGNDASVAVIDGLSQDKNAKVAAAAKRSLQRLTPRPPNAPRLS